ncbi:DciA family protein [Aureimonas sp. Leaf324]|jgi:hypothetical protein|uniref:DUF721 domain-containing protein n=1 Tax=Aureimonas sp. Leaf324 TaxID=1736336 RepID=UPI0006FA3FD9|nr:DciA family protein [Aureimonas sp. Leaf324]KQQ91176.1 hypothetical protein ASF65_01200 [Aureimonas sp. Leaf324]
MKPASPKGPGRAARPIGDLVSQLVEPVVARKAGMSLDLIGAWPEIVGPRLEEGCRPEKLVWPKGYGDETALPATLVIACEGAFALRLQHEVETILSRVNDYFGYRAVDRIKIVQRAVRQVRPNRKPAVGPLTASHRETIRDATARIESDALRRALERLGESVLRRNAAARDRDKR